MKCFGLLVETIYIFSALINPVKELSNEYISDLKCNLIQSGYTLDFEFKKNDLGNGNLIATLGDNEVFFTHIDTDQRVFSSISFASGNLSYTGFKELKFEYTYQNQTVDILELEVRGLDELNFTTQEKLSLDYVRLNGVSLYTQVYEMTLLKSEVANRANFSLSNFIKMDLENNKSLVNTQYHFLIMDKNYLLTWNKNEGENSINLSLDKLNLQFDDDVVPASLIIENNDIYNFRIEFTFSMSVINVIGDSYSGYYIEWGIQDE